MAAYYNEIDPFAAAWLRNLITAGHIAPGDVDTRSIVDVSPSDLRGYTQCHFFAGIAGWSYAARLAGWPDDRPLWTGSCPCQPFSSASRGRGKGISDARHLWPYWFNLIQACRPAVVFGEQVDEALAWLDAAVGDMEREGYVCDAVILPAWAAGFDHARERIYFACYADGQSQPASSEYGEMAGLPRVNSVPGRVAPANGVPARVGKLRAYGNAIVPQVAAEVVGAYLDAERLRLTGVFA